MEKLRTIDNVIVELKKADPETALTGWALRQLVKDGKIPVMMVGSKQLLSLESVERYIENQFVRRGAE